jgi:orotidine-5'-phosphate decarboxylase
MDIADQKRTMTPGEAIECGATHIVVGRPTTRAADPRAAALAVFDEIREGLAQR